MNDWQSQDQQKGLGKKGPKKIKECLDREWMGKAKFHLQESVAVSVVGLTDERTRPTYCYGVTTKVRSTDTYR